MHAEHQGDVANCLTTTVRSVESSSFLCKQQKDQYATNNSNNEVLFPHDLPRIGSFCDKIYTVRIEESDFPFLKLQLCLHVTRCVQERQSWG